MLYNVRQEKEGTSRFPLSHLDNSKPESESQDSAIKPGSPVQCCQLLPAINAPQGPLSTNTKSQPLFNSMNSSLQLLAAIVAAASFGVAVAQTAMLEPVHQHSGTQPYVRVVR